MAKENSFMDMIDKGVKDTKKEGIMTAEQYKLGGDLNYVIEMMKNETDPDKLEELKSIIREMLGTSPYMSIRQDPVRKAADGGFMEKIKSLLDKFKTNNDEPRFFAGQPLNEAAENDPRYQAEIKKKVYRDLGYTDEEIDEIVKKGAGDFLGLGEVLNKIEPSNKAEGGIVHLAPGGSTDDVPLKKTIKTPSTYTGRAFEDFLMDAGFTKKDEKTGKIRGAKGLWNSFLLKQGIVPGSDDATDALNKILKSKGKQLYISTNMAQGKFGLPLVEEITGTVKGQKGAALRDNTFQQLEEIRLDANDKYGKNPTNKKYDYIEKEVIKKFPKVAGTTVLSNFITGKALGAIGAFMPSELEAGTIYSPEDMDKILGEMKIREKFK